MTDRLLRGVAVPNFGQEPAGLIELGVAAEAAGFDGFFLWDHIVFSDGGDGPPIIDPRLVLAVVAARTPGSRGGRDLVDRDRQAGAPVLGGDHPPGGRRPRRDRGRPPPGPRSPQRRRRKGDQGLDHVLQMVVHRRLGGGRVPRRHRGDDRLVLRQRDGGPAGHQGQRELVPHRLVP